MSRPSFRLGLFAAFGFLLGFTYEYQLPRIESFLLIQVENLSAKHSPIRVWAHKLNFHLFPLGIVLEDVRTLPKAPLDRYLAPMHLKEAGARLALLPLLRGEVRLSQVFIRDSEVNVFLRKELFAKSSTPSSAIKVNFDQIYKLPIDELLFEHVQLQGRVEPQGLAFRLNDLTFSLENRFRSLYVDINTPEAMVKPSGPVKPLNGQIDVRTLVEANEIQISAFKVKINDSFLVASGRFTGDLIAGRFENGALDARARVHLPDLNGLNEVFEDLPKIPVSSGQVDIDSGVEMKKGKILKVRGEVNTKDVQVDEFKIGNLHTRFESDLKTLKSDDFVVTNSAGKLQIKALNATLEPNPSVSFKPTVAKINLPVLLANIGITHVPILLEVSGTGECKGTWSEKKELVCKGDLTAPRFAAYASKKSTIVDVNDLRLQGEAKIGMQQVDFKGDVQVGKNSKGNSQGSVSYEKGFQIFYEGTNVDLADVKNLVNLKLEGVTTIKGRTDGTSDWATIDLALDGKDLWLEDYPLGQVSTQVKYKAGQLTFEKGEGQYGVTRYSGDVGIDLHRDRIKIKTHVPFADLKDIQAMFQRKIHLPIEASGTGTGDLVAEGPFRFQDMSYTLKSNFYRGQIADETFDDLTFNVTSTNGLVKSDLIRLTKSTGSIEAKGQITPKGEIDTVLVGRALRLEQSENLGALGLDIQGLADLTMLIRGQLPKPRIELNGRLSRVVIGDQSADDSVFKLNFLPDRLEGSGQLLGSTLSTDFIFPYEEQGPFLFKLKTKKWDFTNLFSLVSKSAKQLDFSTSVTMDMHLAAPKGGFWKSTGEVLINEFNLRKGSKSMGSEKPMILNVKDGVVNSNHFAITSGESYLKLAMANFSRENLNASLNGKLDMSLLGLFTPFISDLRGNISISMDLKGGYDKPVLSGSAYIDRGYAKFTDFVHPFANVRADLLFNDNQILINSLDGDLASGKINGNGKIGFVGKSHPVDVRGVFNEVKLNVPDGFHTQGSGSISITGSNFPYTMGIKYEVTGGEVVYEFANGDEQSNTIKASSYLPRFLNKESFNPFTFNTDVTIKDSLLVNNSLVRANVTGSIKAMGTPDHLLLTGTLTPQPGGKVFFHDTPFDIVSGYVEYQNYPPNAPRIYLTANTHATETVQDDQQRMSENQYDVNLLLQGRGPMPQIVLTSTPSLSQKEIVSLLALGMTTSAMEERRTQDVSSSQASTALGAAILQKAGSRKLKDSLGVDVKVTSSQATIDNASSPKVTLSKQWTPKFGASASSTLQANPSKDVKLEYRMNKNLSVIGSWNSNENISQQVDTTPNVFGLDLEYKVPFK